MNKYEDIKNSIKKKKFKIYIYIFKSKLIKMIIKLKYCLILFIQLIIYVFLLKYY